MEEQTTGLWEYERHGRRYFTSSGSFAQERGTIIRLIATTETTNNDSST